MNSLKVCLVLAVCLTAGRAAEMKRDIDSGPGSYQEESEDSAVGGTSVAAEAGGGATSYSSFTQTGSEGNGYHSDGSPAPPVYSPTPGHSAFPTPSYGGQASFSHLGSHAPSPAFQPNPVSAPVFTPGHGTFSNQRSSIPSPVHHNFVNQPSFPQGSPNFGGQAGPQFGSGFGGPTFTTHSAPVFRNSPVFGGHSLPLIGGQAFNGHAAPATFTGQHFGNPSVSNFAPSFGGQIGSSFGPHAFPAFRGHANPSFGNHLTQYPGHGALSFGTPSALSHASFPGSHGVHNFGNQFQGNYAAGFQNPAPVVPTNFATHGASGYGNFGAGSRPAFSEPENTASYSQDVGSRTGYGDYPSSDITGQGANSEGLHNDVGSANNDHGSSRVASDSNDGFEGSTGHKATSYQSFVLHSYPSSTKREGKVDGARHRADEIKDSKASDHY